jgi:hypothetical protein
MKTDTKTDWNDMIETMVQIALDGHKNFGNGTLFDKESCANDLADNIQAFKEACYDRFLELTEGDIT